MNTTQKKCIATALKRGDRLTPLQALNKFGCFRLAARISELRAEGMQIQSRLINVNGKTVAQYYQGRA